jgi:predicted enzyme related to lactoylglutathione lyase
MPMQPDISFIEIGSSDAAGTGRFLGQLFGWPLQPMGNVGEGWLQTPTMKAGLHGNDPSPGFLVFFAVPDVEMARSKVIALGGSAEPPTDEPGFGRFCICADPSGLKFGLHGPSE